MIEPSIVELARNATSAASRAFIAAVSGEQVFVSEEARTARIAVCFKCDAYDDALGECGICGCYIGLKSKLATEHCPSRKWPGDTAVA